MKKISQKMVLKHFIFIILLLRFASSRSLVDIITTTEYQEETTTEATTENPKTSTKPSNTITLEINRSTPTSSPTKSLYEELSAATSYPTFSSPFTSSSVEQVSSELKEEENESTEEYRLESTLATDEDEDFKNNSTKEEHHRLDEIKIDEMSVFYSSTHDFTTTTALPTPKKGKYLELMPPGEDNMNTSLPNAAEVWALAGMRDMDLKNKPTTESSVDSDVEVLSNNTIKSLLDWSEIARFDNSSESIATDLTEATAQQNEIAVTSPFLPSTTSKSISNDNRLELEHENTEFTPPANKSDIDGKHLDKYHDDESSVELVAPINEKKLENLVTLSDTTTFEPFTLVEDETTTIEATTSFVDTITSGSDENSEVFKRTITELPEDYLMSTSTPTALTTMTESEVPPTTATSSSLENTSNILNARSTMVTKSISIRIATTTEEPSTTIDTNFESMSVATIEIMDDDKFKYSTLLPEGTVAVSHISPTVHQLNDSTRSGVEGIASTAGVENGGSNVALISILVSIVIIVIIATGFVLFKKRKKKLTYGQRCRPVGLDAYSLDNVSVFNSVRRKANALRFSKRSYANSAFEDPTLQSNVLDYQSLQKFSKNKIAIYDEFKEIPQISYSLEGENCENVLKNRYANVVPLPLETIVKLEIVNNDENSKYINANYVKGPKDTTNYYIATQAPLENTVMDFWRMIYQENSKVIIMLTDLTENGVEKCAEYMPSSVVVDNSLTFGDFQVTLKSREVKGKYAVSQLHLKNLKTRTWREIMHFWYSWPDSAGSLTDETSVIAMLLEARSYVRTSLPDHVDEKSNAENNNNFNDDDKLSTLDKTKSLQRIQGPLTVHCSPGTGRTGTIIACDVVLRMLEIPPRQIDIPQIVYNVRRGRANAIKTKEQYEFIYRVANAYATKLNSVPTES